jgi:hypothetical protein
MNIAAREYSSGAEMRQAYIDRQKRLWGQPKVVNRVRAFTVVETVPQAVTETVVAEFPIFYPAPTAEMRANEPKAHLLSLRLWKKWEGRQRTPQEYVADICKVFGTNRREIKSLDKRFDLVKIRHHIWKMTAEEFPDLSNSGLSRLFNRNLGAILYVFRNREKRREQMRAYNDQHERGKKSEAV